MLALVYNMYSDWPGIVNFERKIIPFIQIKREKHSHFVTAICPLAIDSVAIIVQEPASPESLDNQRRLCFITHDIRNSIYYHTVSWAEKIGSFASVSGTIFSSARFPLRPCKVTVGIISLELGFYYAALTNKRERIERYYVTEDSDNIKCLHIY